MSLMMLGTPILRQPQIKNFPNHTQKKSQQTPCLPTILCTLMLEKATANPLLLPTTSWLGQGVQVHVPKGAQTDVVLQSCKWIRQLLTFHNRRILVVVTLVIFHLPAYDQGVASGLVLMTLL